MPENLKYINNLEFTCFFSLLNALLFNIGEIKELVSRFLN